MLVKIEARILIFQGTDFYFPSTSVPPGTFLRSGPRTPQSNPTEKYYGKHVLPQNRHSMISDHAWSMKIIVILCKMSASTLACNIIASVCLHPRWKNCDISNKHGL